jgi:hypothetical protein
MKFTTLILAVLLSYGAFAQGFYFEMKMSSNKQPDMGTVKVYAQNGNSRSEIHLAAMDMDIIALVLSGTPNMVYMLNDKDKTYSEMDASKNSQWKDNATEDYDITVLGKENVNGYNSTHVKIKRKDSKVEEEEWVSTEVNDYASFAMAKTKFTGRMNLYKALEAKGVKGFPVRIITSTAGNQAQIDFVKAEKRDNPASLFSFDGYKKTDNAAMGGATMQEMMKKIQSMTPEQQKAFIEQMKQQNQQSH